MFKKMSESDAVKWWFKFLEEQGEYIHIRFFRTHLDTGKVEHYTLDHGEFDGISGYVELIQKHEDQYKFEDFNIQIPKRKFPPKIFVFLSFIKYLSTIPFYSSKWKKLNPNWKKGMKLSAPTCFHCEILTKDESAKIIELAKAKQVSVTTYLLCSLDRALKPLLKEGGKRYWLIPVSLRSFFDLNIKGNITGFFDLAIDDKHDMKYFNNQMIKKVNRGDAFGGFFGVTIGSIIGKTILKFLVTINHYLQVRTGVFTNYGHWKKETESNTFWTGLPPVIYTQPVGVMTGMKFGRIALTLQFHQMISEDPQVAKDCIKSWKEILLQD